MDDNELINLKEKVAWLEEKIDHMSDLIDNLMSEIPFAEPKIMVADGGQPMKTKYPQRHRLGCPCCSGDYNSVLPDDICDKCFDTMFGHAERATIPNRYMCGGCPNWMNITGCRHNLDDVCDCDFINEKFRFDKAVYEDYYSDRRRE